MKESMIQLLVVYGAKICAWVTAIASLAPHCCRGTWYQPEEPEGVEEFFRKQ